jgi:hypothetical protein
MPTEENKETVRRFITGIVDRKKTLRLGNVR